MTSWRNPTSFVFLLALLITAESSNGGCHNHFRVNESKLYLDKEILLIQTKDVRNNLECSLERKCRDAKNQKNDTFCAILYHCFSEQDRDEFIIKILPKCEGEPHQIVSFHIFMCMVGAATNNSMTGCQGLDLTCQSSSNYAHSTTITTPTTLPERRTTTTALQPNTTSVQPSPTTSTTLTNLQDPVQDKFVGNSTKVTADCSTAWTTACSLIVIVCICVCVGLVFYLCKLDKKNKQLLEENRNLIKATELQQMSQQPDAKENETTTLIEHETPTNGGNMENGSLP